jgi:hypothetical protein
MADSIRITRDIREEAFSMAKDMGSLQGSILKGQGNTAGFIGKIMVFNLLKGLHYPEVKYIKSNNISTGGLTVAIRTKQRTVAPKSFYNCSVTLDSLKEEFDYFAFCQVDEEFRQFWLLGFVPWDRFLKESHILHKGERDGKFTVRESCRNIKIGDLEPTLVLPGRQ